jgi:hypothetical protein
MDDKSALIALKNLIDRKSEEVSSCDMRLKQLNEDYAEDAWPDTAAQIERVAARLTRARVDLDALTVAISKF